jgi:hypothetical protein
LPCPICQKRKAKRFCPAQGANICSVCCGTEREVTIDCPSDCPHLIASRAYDWERKEVDWSQGPFPEAKLDRGLVARHTLLMDAMAHAVCLLARDNRPLVDSDLVAALKALAETYRTLASGIYYENPPGYRLQHDLYKSLQAAVEDFKKKHAQTELTTLRDSEVRDVLIFMAQVGHARQNGRPKGRAFIDALCRPSKSLEPERPAASNIVLLP